MDLPVNVLDFLKDNNIFKYSLTKEGLLDINQSVKIKKLVNNEIPYPIYRIRGRFDCSHLGMTSMKNFPSIVYEKCYLQNNKFTSLENAPKKAKEFFISQNPIKNLIGCPETTKIVAQRCNLNSLEGICSNLKMLSITENPELLSLDFFNQSSIDILILSNTGIESLNQPLTINKFLNLNDSNLKLINPDVIHFSNGASFSINESVLENCDRGIEFFMKNKDFLSTPNNDINYLLNICSEINKKRKINFLINNL